MHLFKKWTAATLIFTLTTVAAQTQPFPFAEEPDYSSAYQQTHQTAHWSAYVPIGIVVAAAIWFGVADDTHSCSDSGSSYYTKSYSKYRCNSYRSHRDCSKSAHSH